MKATAPTLSEHLLLEAKRFRGYPGLAGRGKLNRAVTALWDEKALPSSARSLEWIMPEGHVFRATPSLLNEYYSKQLLAEVPGIVTRASALQPLESGKAVPRQVNMYHEQATRSYVAGLWDGAVALARACLEEALEDQAGKYLGHQQRDLSVWIAEAERKHLLPAIQLSRSRVIQGFGNAVLHERSAIESEAEQAVRALRDLLGDLYR
jgi:hypothetical protein